MWDPRRRRDLRGRRRLAGADQLAGHKRSGYGLSIYLPAAATISGDTIADNAHGGLFLPPTAADGHRQPDRRQRRLRRVPRGSNGSNGSSLSNVALDTNTLTGNANANSVRPDGAVSSTGT